MSTLARLLIRWPAYAAALWLLASCSTLRQEAPPFAYCEGECANTRLTAAPADITKNIFHTAEVLDCISVSARGCSHVYPQEADLELCNITEISNHKADGHLISGPDIFWSGNGRQDGVMIGIKVAGDRFTGAEAYYIYHIGMNVYSRKLPQDVIGALRGYCTGQPNTGIGGKDTYTHCVCGGPEAGGVRREVCHVYKDGKIVNTIPGNDNRCR